ncbi:MAG: NYN domain-containing protein [Clostridia bacterium]|nr:NYN domain-containing protein [Clostridia bacterium]
MQETWIVDGYNVIHAWPEMERRIDEVSLDAAREMLIEELVDFQGSAGHQIVIVFDAYSSASASPQVTEEKRAGINVVYTAKEQTADSYIEIFVEQLHKKDKYATIRVVTGDALEQGTIFSFGAARMTTRELRRQLEEAHRQLEKQMEDMERKHKERLEGRLPREIAEILEELRRSK